MESMVQELGLGDRAIFYGERNDVPQLMPGLDVLVSASDSEGFSNTILEAMAAGVAVVATAVGGTPEVVIDRETGMLVPRGDAAAMGKALSTIALDESLRHKLGAAGRRRVEEEFSVGTMAQRTVELYRSLLSS